MAKFFFDIDDGDNSTHDDVGQEFTDLKAARDAAISVLPDIAKWVLPDGEHRTFVSVVRDGRGKRVFRATLTLACDRL